MAVKKKSPTKKKSTVNSSGNYTKPGLRKKIYKQVLASNSGGAPGKISARKMQEVARKYKAAGGGYTS